LSSRSLVPPPPLTRRGFHGLRRSLPGPPSSFLPGIFQGMPAPVGVWRGDLGGRVRDSLQGRAGFARKQGPALAGGPLFLREAPCSRGPTGSRGSGFSRGLFEARDHGNIRTLWIVIPGAARDLFRGEKQIP